MISKKEEAMLLLSGGMDSVACLDFLLSKSFKVTCLFVNYGQLALKNERSAVKRIIKFYKVKLIEVDVSGVEIGKAGYIQGRNLFLFSIALAKVKFKRGIISSGIHRGTNYNDCTPLFHEKVQDIYDIYSEGRIKIFSPFADWDKKDIWNYCQIKNVPVSLTYSCEKGLKKPCGNCLSCIDLKNLYASENK